MDLLKIENVAVALKKKLVIKNLSTTLARGSLVGILGPNGSGKTTFLKCIASLIHPKAGVIFYKNQFLSSLTPQQRSQEISYLPARPTCYWRLKVFDIVSLGRAPFHAHQLSLTENDKTAIHQALKETDTEVFSKEYFSDLSTGEQSRVMMARALATNPELLLADEPLSGLDPKHQLALMKILKERTSAGKTALVVLHELPLAFKYCDKVLLLKDGFLKAYETPRKLLKSPLIEECFEINSKELNTFFRL